MQASAAQTWMLRYVFLPHLRRLRWGGIMQPLLYTIVRTVTTPTEFRHVPMTSCGFWKEKRVVIFEI
jgi:hypothetical protein